jgi:hypothetical protein
MTKFYKYPEHDFTLFIAELDSTADEYIQVLKDYKDIGATKYEMYDLSRLKLIFSPGDVHKIVKYHSETDFSRPLGSKTALFASSALIYALARMYEMIAEVKNLPWETRVFNTIRDVGNWLEIEDISEIISNEIDDINNI